MKTATIMTVLILFALAALLTAPFLGITDVSRDVIFHPRSQSPGTMVFWQIRVPRVLTAFLAGIALAVSGMAFQAMFRNPLATPFTLGVSSGASLGAVIAMRAGLAASIWNFSATSGAAFLGALMAIGLVYGLVRLKGQFSTPRLLLAGIAISFFFSSLIMFVHYTSDFHNTFRLMRWLMGGLSMSGYDTVINLLPFCVAGLLIVLYLTHELNLLATGDELALSRGVNVGITRHVLFFAVSLLVGSVVALCGPIGFVGMMVPHMCRLIVGSNHRRLFPATLLFGGTFLTVCDTLARMIAPPAEIPVGVITALLGGPFFLWLLLGRSEAVAEI
ncbi:iron ABC transporter permease [bacterium]|nr:iron ABC transporter permease [candidate division CSSED10-310 bacterium]